MHHTLSIPFTDQQELVGALQAHLEECEITSGLVFAQGRIRDGKAQLHVHVQFDDGTTVAGELAAAMVDGDVGIEVFLDNTRLVVGRGGRGPVTARIEPPALLHPVTEQGRMT